MTARVTRVLVAALLLAACDDGTTPAEAPPDPDSTTADLGLDAMVADADAAPPDAFVHADLPRMGDAAEPDGPPGLRHVWVGVNDIPEDMLGEEPVRFGGRDAPFEWSLPPTGWTLDVHVEHGPDWSPPADPPYLLWRGVSVVMDRHVIDPATLEPPGGAWIERRSEHVWRARVMAPLPGGPGVFSVQSVVDGETTVATKVAIAERTPGMDPFPQDDNWLVRWDRDLGSVEVDEALRVRVGAPNGVPDWEEAVAAIGLLGGDADWREGVLRRIRETVRAHLRDFFFSDAEEPDRVRIAVHFDGDPDLPPPEEQVGWSYMAIGGADPEAAPGRTFFGRADLDWNNQVANDNTGPNRGVFTTSFVAFVLGNDITAAIIEEYLPGRGDPFGSLPTDAAFVEPDFDPDALPQEQQFRANRYVFVVDLVSLAMASVLAHEMGHSLGLVPSGPPPDGLLAEVDGPWVVKEVDGAHIDTPGFNLMQSGSSFSFGDLSGGSPRFNAPNLAYLRRVLLVTPP